MKDTNPGRTAGVVWVFCVILGFWSGPAPAADTLDFRVATARVLMKDSVELNTEIYLPPGDGRYPTVLLRTPYGAANKDWVGTYLAPRGYAVVVQNVRGTNGSGGEFFPFAYEKSDGVQTLQWITEQPWFNGKVGLWGISYHGYTAFQIAETGHPALAAMFVISGWDDLAPFLSHGGAFHLMAHLRWFYSYAARQPDPPEEAWDGIFRTVPIIDFFRGAEGIMDELAARPFDYAAFKVPTLHMSGWFDYIYPNTIGAYENILRHSPKAGPQKLQIGMWPHNDILRGTTTAGDEDFGPAAAMGMEKVLELTRRWFDLHLRGIDDGIAAEPPVQVFVMGENAWHDYDAWPPPGIEFISWYAASQGAASGREGNGRLSAQRANGKSTDSFTYDPLDCVPTVGGANFHFFPENLGVKNQATVEGRADVLVYTSDPLADDLLVVGPLKAIVYASTDGKDTDFTAKLTVVRPDGYVRNVEDGILRARFAFGLDSTHRLVPDKVYRFEIDMGATALRIEKGSRLRLDISSSNFPKYDRNPNTGEDPMRAVEFRPARQTIYHSERYPTQVVLPVIAQDRN